MWRRHSERAFTLFEVIIVIFIISLISGIVISQIGDVFHANLKETASRFGSTIRYLYNKSAAENVYLRLVYDLDNNSYWVESSDSPVLLSRSEVKEKGAQSAGEDDGGQEVQSAGEENGEEEVKPSHAKFGAVDSHLLRSSRLPNGVYFKDIQTEHDTVPVTSGKAYTYFFPNGYVERTVINLRDEDDEVNYALVIEPLGGKVKIYDQYRELNLGGQSTGYGE